MKSRPIMIGTLGAALIVGAASYAIAAAAPKTDDTYGGCSAILADGSFPTGPDLRDWVRHGYPSQIYYDPVKRTYANVFTVPSGAPGYKADIKPATMLDHMERDYSQRGAEECYLPPAGNNSGFYDAANAHS